MGVGERVGSRPSKNPGVVVEEGAGLETKGSSSSRALASFWEVVPGRELSPGEGEAVSLEEVAPSGECPRR